VQDIKALNDTSLAGGGFLNGFSLFGLGTLESIAVIVLGLIGINAATN